METTELLLRRLDKPDKGGQGRTSPPYGTAAALAIGPEAISHVSPLMRRHVIVNGTYDFTLRGVEGRGQLFV